MRCLQLTSIQSQPPPQVEDTQDESDDDEQITPEVCHEYFGRIDEWCQGILGLEDSQLNSLWYERLADASRAVEADTQVSREMYEKAAEHENPSWECHRSLAKVYFDLGLFSKAISRLQTILGEHCEGSGSDQLSLEDQQQIHLMLGKYANRAKKYPLATEHYLLACESDDPRLKMAGTLGCLTVRLTSSDNDNVAETKKLLWRIIGEEGGQDHVVSLLEMIAEDLNHDDLMLNMLAAVSEEHELLGKVMAALQTASDIAQDSTTGISSEVKAISPESRAVLLYYLGIAKRRYDTSNEIENREQDILKLWRDSLKQLTGLKGPNVTSARYRVVSMLAKHHFDSLLNNTPNAPDQRHIEALQKLRAEQGRRNDALAFLCVHFSMGPNKDEARALRMKNVKYALDLLSDKIEDNDMMGFGILQRCLGQSGDLEGAAIATSLIGQPDLVTAALQLKTDDVDDSHHNRPQILDDAAVLATDVVRETKRRVGSASGQLQRIKEAKSYVEHLAGTNDPASVGDCIECRVVQSTPRNVALTLFHSRLSELEDQHTPNPKINGYWICDGRSRDGTRCRKKLDDKQPFYHCLYCSSRDFCQECFDILHQPTSNAITVCGINHRWLYMPPHGDEMYVGPAAESVRRPVMKPCKGSPNVQVAVFDEESQTISKTDWLQGIAEAWRITL